MDDAEWIRELYRKYWQYMIGKSRVLAAVYGGGKHSWRLRGDFTLRKENGRWKFSSSSASTY